jgi:DNA-binding transcriptional LysR family regulator
MARIVMERSGELEVFLRVVHEGGFSAAARSLDLTPSAVSKLVARLESRLGAALLTRTTRALTLTEEGRCYFEAAKRALQEIENAEQAVVSGVIRGRLAVNASVPFGTHLVVPALPSFQAQHPGIIVDVSFTDDVVNMLAQKADVAIRVGNLPDSALVARKLGQSRRVVCAAPSYVAKRGAPRTPHQLRDHDCLTFNFRRSRSGWPFREDGRDIDFPISGSIQTNNGETMRQLVLAGLGIARLGLWHVAELIARGDLVVLLEDYNPGEVELIHAIHVGGGHVPRRVRAFIDHMVAYVGSSPLFAGA